ncbi:hypothetical protein RJT34_24905 [Clitoria ternatea]|uniref:Uncharacterized protein n=1 Tax=Clitoria ternatea TaxID=43366 RepID=A0AAN9FRJ5_CLITE
MKVNSLHRLCHGEPGLESMALGLKFELTKKVKNFNPLHISMNEVGRSSFGYAEHMLKWRPASYPFEFGYFIYRERSKDGGCQQWRLPVATGKHVKLGKEGNVLEPKVYL